jgi:hypothetical protein
MPNDLPRGWRVSTRLLDNGTHAVVSLDGRPFFQVQLFRAYVSESGGKREVKWRIERTMAYPAPWASTRAWDMDAESVYETLARFANDQVDAEDYLIGEDPSDKLFPEDDGWTTISA